MTQDITEAANSSYITTDDISQSLLSWYAEATYIADVAEDVGPDAVLAAAKAAFGAEEGRIVARSLIMVAGAEPKDAAFFNRAIQPVLSSGITN